ncbi:MAG: hypothetical protein NPIRA06_12460 [Nitrospirales bacterium]|nr:MAG: hypothetical protein NPIRA06_12460 [Nitrospirales bacterium]
MATMGNVLADESGEFFLWAEGRGRGVGRACWLLDDFPPFLSVDDFFGEKRDAGFERILDGVFFAGTNRPCSHLNEFEYYPNTRFQRQCAFKLIPFHFQVVYDWKTQKKSSCCRVSIPGPQFSPQVMMINEVAIS